MYGSQQEEVGWARLKDMQREMENPRYHGENTGAVTLRALGTLLQRAWLLAGLAHRRPPRRHAAARIEAAAKTRETA